MYFLSRPTWPRQEVARVGQVPWPASPPRRIRSRLSSPTKELHPPSPTGHHPLTLLEMVDKAFNWILLKFYKNAIVSRTNVIMLQDRQAEKANKWNNGIETQQQELILLMISMQGLSCSYYPSVDSVFW